MTHYHHKQTGNARYLLLAALAVAVVLWLTLPARAAALLVALGIGLTLVAAMGWLFSSLTVEVSERELAWHFGPGAWRKRVALADIVRIERVRLPQWYGTGIKYNRRFSSYLVAPGDAVEIALRDGTVMRIGTDDLDNLVAALAKPH